MNGSIKEAINDLVEMSLVLLMKERDPSCLKDISTELEKIIKDVILNNTRTQLGFGYEYYKRMLLVSLFTKLLNERLEREDIDDFITTALDKYSDHFDLKLAIEGRVMEIMNNLWGNL